MCMLYVKPENFTMPQEYLDSLKRRNNDGLAIYNKATNSVFKTLDYKAGYEYMANNHNNELVVHFRFGTSGKKSMDQLHGFSVCNDEYFLFHNGVLSTVSGNAKEGLSDTQVLVHIFRDEPVDRLVTYLEKHETGSRFLLVNKETQEYIIPKCAKWSGDSTINGTHIIFSNSYAIDGKYLDGYKPSTYPRNTWSSKNNSSTNDYSSYRSLEYYDSLWADCQDELDQEADDFEAKTTIEILETIWRCDRKKAIELIKLYPDIAFNMMYDMMEEKEIALPF